jgi:DNA modification methylase
MTKHPLEEKWDTTAWDILSAIERGFRAQADVKGKLAELYLHRRLLELAERAAIESLVWQDKDGKPDFVITLGGQELRIECKNVRSPQKAKGARDPRVELQKTRNSKDPQDHGRYLELCKLNDIKPHPARFPVQIPTFFIRLLTDPGDLVLDPFAGSNTTGEACEREGRKWIAVEHHAPYLEASRFRFEDELNPLPDRLTEPDPIAAQRSLF